MHSHKPLLKQDDITRVFDAELTKRFPLILSPKQLAAMLGLSIKTVYEWMSRGRLDGAYRKRGKHALFWRDKAIDVIFNGKDWNNG